MTTVDEWLAGRALPTLRALVPGCDAPNCLACSRAAGWHRWLREREEEAERYRPARRKPPRRAPD